MIFDTDVLIWFMRNNSNAVKTVSDNGPFLISAVTKMELIQGVKNKQELDRLKNMIEDFCEDILQINEVICEKASNFVEMYSLSRSMEMADALIAATCLYYNKPLHTANVRHFSYIPNLKIIPFKPE